MSRLVRTVVAAALSLAIALPIGLGVFYLAQRLDKKPASNAQPLSDTPVFEKEALDSAAVYNEVNSERTSNGVPALANSPELNDAAKQKCDSMVADHYYDHKNPKTGKHGYSYVFDALGERNVAYASENLNQGVFSTNRAIVDSWLNSPSHKAAMLDPQFTHTGVAICQIDAVDTVVQLFADPREKPTVIQQSPQPTYQPTYTTPRTCYTQYHEYSYLDNTATTTCY